MRFLIVLLATFLLERPAHADTPPPPVDPAALTVVQGASAPAVVRDRVGWVPFILTPALSSAWGLVIVWSAAAMAGGTGGSDGAKVLFAALWGLTIDVLFGLPVYLALNGLERLVTGVDRPWYLAALLTPVANALCSVALGVGSIALMAAVSPRAWPPALLLVPIALVFGAHVGVQALGFGSPAPVAWATTNDRSIDARPITP